jgi:hypothetical protein
MITFASLFGVALVTNIAHPAPLRAVLARAGLARAVAQPRLKPAAAIPPSELPKQLVLALRKNNFPEVDAGLESMWDFSTDTTKFVFKNNRTEFIESAHKTAADFATSFYGMAMHGREWELEGEMTMVGGDTADCWIAVQIMRIVSSDGRLRRWQWELRKQRRPPLAGAWFVESIGSSDRLGNFEVD